MLNARSSTDDLMTWIVKVRSASCGTKCSTVFVVARSDAVHSPPCCSGARFEARRDRRDCAELHHARTTRRHRPRKPHVIKRPENAHEHYHAHVYFDEDTVEQARSLCQEAADKFGVTM